MCWWWWWCFAPPQLPKSWHLEKESDYIEEGANTKAILGCWHGQNLLGGLHPLVATPECVKVKSYTLLVCKEYVWKNSRKCYIYIYHCYITLNPKLQKSLDFWNLKFAFWQNFVNKKSLHCCVSMEFWPYQLLWMSVLFYHFCNVASGTTAEEGWGAELAQTKMCWELCLNMVATSKLKVKFLPPPPTLEVKKSGYPWNSDRGFGLIFFCIWSFQGDA